MFTLEISMHQLKSCRQFDGKASFRSFVIPRYCFCVQLFISRGEIKDSLILFWVDRTPHSETHNLMKL